MPCFRIPASCYEFFLVMFFATEEINENPYLLRNMSLMFSITVGLIQDTLGLLEKAYEQQNNGEYITNYICGNYNICDISITGPSWKTSAKLAFYSGLPQVRMCETE